MMGLSKNVTKTIHIKCRNKIYPRCSSLTRLPVPDQLVPWEIPWDEYLPPDYTDPRIKGQSWADSEDTKQVQWNSVDNGIDRTSHEGPYKVVNLPLNPIGRTGLSGRGCLGRWGPNHAADPIVTRWKPNQPALTRVLQFVAIERRDCGEWALPGGMVDPGETVNNTLKREFMEEALNSLELQTGEEAQQLVDKIFENGIEVYRGYVDDPRNTDNAWIETVAVNYHDEAGTSGARLSLNAGDDACRVRWMDLDTKVNNLYASHAHLLHQVYLLHNK